MSGRPVNGIQWHWIIAVCLALAIGAVLLAGCTSRDQLRGPSEQQRAYDGIRPMIDTMRGPGF